MDENMIVSGILLVKKIIGAPAIFCLDYVISKTDWDLTDFIRNLRTTIISPRMIALSIDQFIIRVGYGTILKNTIKSFTESLVKQQWVIALNKLGKNGDTTDHKCEGNLHFIVVVNETVTAVSRKEATNTRQLDRFVDSCSKDRTESSDCCKKRKLEETDNFTERIHTQSNHPQEITDTNDCQTCNENTFPEDMNSNVEIINWPNTFIETDDQNTFLEDMNTITTDCVLFESTLETFEKAGELRTVSKRERKLITAK